MTQIDNQYLNRVVFDRFLEAATRLTKKQRAIDESKVERLAAQYFHAQGTAFVLAFQARHKPLNESRAEVDGIFAALVKTGDLTLAKIQALCKKHYLGGMTFADRSLNLGLNFDLKNPRAVAYFKEFKSRLKNDLDSTTKERIETIITQGLEDGVSYDVIARMIKQEFASFAKPPKGGPKHIRTRAQLVAVTELGDSYAAGSIGMVRGAMGSGLQFEKAWLTSRDSRVSDGCRENAAIGWIPIDTPFPSGHDHPTRFPGCRCDILLRRKTIPRSV